MPPAALLRLGAGLGSVTSALLLALQTSSAWAADMLWTLGPLPGRVLLTLAAGALVGALAALVLEPLRRRLVPDLGALALCVGAIGLLGAGGRVLASAALRGHQGLPGGRPAALAVAALGHTLVLVFVVRWLAARDGRRSPFVDGVALIVASLGATHLAHMLLLASKSAVQNARLLGAPALAVLLGSLLLGALAGLTLRTRRRELRLGVAAAVLGGIVLGTGAQVPPHLVAPTAPRTTPGREPHVLVVVLDTLRRDAVSAYGLVEGTTPHLDAFAARGTRFTDVLASGCWTVPSHASLFTGAEVSRHGAGWSGTRLRRRPGPDGAVLPTLAELFAAEGRHTAAFVANMNVSRANGFDRGFAEFHEVWRAGQGDYDVLAPAVRSWLGLGVHDKGGHLILGGLDEWLTRHADDTEPWLLFVNLMEAHAPYGQVPQAFTRAFLGDAEPGPDVAALLDDPKAWPRAGAVSAAQADQLWRAYLGAVHYQDHLLGRLLAALSQRDLTDEVLVVVTSDHGENFGWHGRLGHGQDLNDDLLRIPLVLAGPGVPRGEVRDTPAGLVDLLPTLAALADVSLPPPDVGRTGVDLFGDEPIAAQRPRLAERQPRLADERVAADWRAGRAALFVGRDKLVDVLGPCRELLDGRLTRRVGPGRPPHDDGRAPLADEASGRRLAEALRAWRGRWPAALAAQPAPGLDERDAGRLAGFGHLGR